jgi:hypothetical protein
MSTIISAGKLVQQLHEAGFRPKEHIVKQILAQGPAILPLLIDLATDFDILHEEEEPDCYGPLHALRLLGEIGDPAAIAPLLEALPVPVYESDEETGYVDMPGNLWGNEVMQIIAHCGPDVATVLWEWASNNAHSAVSRDAAIAGLAYVATLHNTREEIISEARRRLQEDPDPVVTTGLVNLLADLGDKQSYSAIMAAYRSGKVNQNRMPAAVARQLLLGGGRQSLNCVAHTLWERYDHHGPGPMQDQYSL